MDTSDMRGHLPWSEEQWDSGAASRWWLWPQWWAAAAAQPLLWAQGLQRTHVWATGPGSGSGWSAGELRGSRWRRTGWTPKTKTSGPRVTPLPRLPTLGMDIISPRPLNRQIYMPTHPGNFRIPRKRSPTAHQAGRHIHRQSGQISGWGWCWEGTTGFLESLRFCLQVQSPKTYLWLQAPSQFLPLFFGSCLNSGLSDTWIRGMKATWPAVLTHPTSHS